MSDQGRSKRGGKDQKVLMSIEKLFDRLPPHSLESEMSLLGSMILDPAVIADVLPHVSTDEMFYSAAHGAIFKEIIGLYEQHQSGDLVMLVDRLRDRHVLKDIGGEEYLVKLAEAVPAATSAPYYARMVADKHRLRKLIDAAGQILYDAYHPTDDSASVNEVVDKAEGRIFAIAEQAQSNDAQALGELLQQEIERLESIEGKGVSGIPTGYHALDDKLSGLHPGEMIIVAARPSMGKTALALNMGLNVARENIGVGVFSLEMSAGQLATRLLCIEGRVDAGKVRTGYLSREHDWPNLTAAAESLYKMPIFLDDTPGVNITQVRSKARRLKAQCPNLGLLILDYIGLMSGDGRVSRQEQIAQSSRGLKGLAKELGVCVLALSQLNRAVEQRNPKVPQISDLRESGAIEQDADIIMFLYRDEVYNRDSPDNKGLAEVLVRKQRNGNIGEVDLAFRGQYARFENLERDFR